MGKIVSKKYLDENRYIISVSTLHPKDFKNPENTNKQYILDINPEYNQWEITPIFSEAQTFTLKEASQITCVLNKINKCYYQIVPTFEIQLFESKLNTFPDEL
jgi:hypothetical protein